MLANYGLVKTPGIAVATTTNWTEVAAIAQAASAVIAVLALLGVLIQLAQNRRHARAARAYQYLERYGAPSEIAINAKLHKFIKIDKSKEVAQCELWERMPTEERFEILHALNFWEELAGMYRRRLVDRAVVRDYFGDSAIAYWNWAEWFISYQREKQPSAELMEELQDMCSRIARGEAAAARRMTFPYARQRRRRA